MIVVKAGGSAITDKRVYAKVRLSVIRRLALELSSSKEKILLVNGAGSFGHTVAKKYDLKGGFRDESQKKGVCRTRLDVARLNAIIVEILAKKGVHALSVSPSSCFSCDGGRIEESFLLPVERMMSLGFMPVFFGDVCFDKEMGFCILSGDQIAAHLAQRFKAKRLILATDVDGLYNQDPKKNRNARLIEKIDYESLKAIYATEVEDVTGGMAGKLREISALKGKGIETDILNLKKKGILSGAIEGRISGTRIHD